MYTHTCIYTCFNGAGTIIAIVATVATVARTITDKSVRMIVFEGIMYAALMPS